MRLIVVFVATSSVNKNEYIMLCVYFSKKCHLLMEDLVVASALFIFLLVLLFSVLLPFLSE